MYDMICITNRKLCKEDFLVRLEKIAMAKPAGVILREKDLCETEYMELAARAMAICSRYSVRCILHSFVNTAIQLGVEEIHVPMPILRRMTAEEKCCFRTLGASCHSEEDALEAQQLGCTYITAGHIFSTDCKQGIPGRGLDFLEAVCRSISIPVYAIGGINCRNIRDVLAAGAVGGCVMSGMMACEDVQKYLSAFEEKNDEIS